jgi:hypothetical protein
MDSATIDVEIPQRVKALARANRVRQARAALKRRIADGHVSAAEVILFHPSEAESMPVADVLTSQRYWGGTRCRRLLLAAGLQENKPIGSMTERQRLALAARLSSPTSSQRTRPGWEENGAPQ